MRTDAASHATAWPRSTARSRLQRHVPALPGVSQLERPGERAGFTEGWLGLVAALTADAPEITSAVTALARGQASVGQGVVIG